MDFHDLLSADGMEADTKSREAHQAGIWTALPGIIVSFNEDAMTVEVQPATRGVATDTDGNRHSVPLPVLPDVPICFPKGGGYTLTFPVAVGDECVVVFSSRSIDDWWQQGGVQAPTDARQHDINDGFAILGPYSQPNRIAAAPSTRGVSTNSVQLRSNDGELCIDMDSGSGGITLTTPQTVTIVSPNVTVHASTAVTMYTPLLKVNGDVQVSGSIIGGSGGGDSVNLQTHRHGTGTSAPGTSPPTAGT